ncbi:MAG: spore coat protein [Clostridiales bacterium]|nr:spore coat protein [Clostridiales bacterium]
MTNGCGCCLTSKDLNVIEDQLTHIAMSCRVAANYANQFQNPQLKNMAATVAQHHRQQYEQLCSILNGCQ